MFETECIVVGGGVIGLAIARRLALDGRDVVLLERATKAGTETSSRSNEVIHAGLYHRPGSPQAVLCARGREALYAYCAKRGIEHSQLGKLVVATDEGSVEWLEEMLERGKANGVPELQILTKAAVSEMEPYIRCAAGIFSPRTGIVDSHALMLAYQADAQASGSVIALGTRFIAAQRTGGRFRVEVESRDQQRSELVCSVLINAAGIWAGEVARAVEGLDRKHIPHIHLAKGAFFTLRGKSPFRRLIVPEPKSWRQGGIFTLDLAGRGRFGPDEQWVPKVDYGLEGWPLAHIYAVVRRYFPALPDDSLTLDYAGIRPRLNGPNEPPADWLFQEEKHHGIPNLVNLFGFESPGITASLAIADVVRGLLIGAPPPFEVDGS